MLEKASEAMFVDDFVEYKHFVLADAESKQSAVKCSSANQQID